jgi:coenzyme F420-reducing hydrogenase gamma subunit
MVFDVENSIPGNPPDESVVYLALKNTFKGVDAQVRKTKKVRELLLKKQHNIDVQELINEHSIDGLCNVAKLLLEPKFLRTL